MENNAKQCYVFHDFKKPYIREECQSGPLDKIPEPEFERWKGILQANILKNPKSLEKASSTNRGQVGDQAVQDSQNIEALLVHISHYGPTALQRDITHRCTSLQEVWTIIRKWAGLKSSGITLQSYYQARHSWDPNNCSATKRVCQSFPSLPADQMAI